MIWRSGLVVAALALALPAGAATADRSTAAERSKAAEKSKAASPAHDAGKKPAAVERSRPSLEKYKLKKGAEGEVCFGCHVQLEKQLARASVHTPVRSRQCTGCHSPHASESGKMLAGEVGATCLGCHPTIVPAKAKSAHAPAAKGECAKCHAPHASDNPKQLTKPAAELCAGCHDRLAKTAAAAKVKHRPVAQGGCATCHDPHGSASAPDLLTRAVPELCLNCHKADKPIFAKRHMDYGVAKARCTSCHDPHGSNTKGMLYDTVHAPVAKGMCGQCHEAPGSPAGFKPKQAGRELCSRCHSSKMAEIMGKGHLHRPVVEGDACLTCHDPHASRQKGLLAASPEALCMTCHADTGKRHDRSPTKHQPVGDGECTACHDVHSSANALLLAKPTVPETCGACHEYKKHTTHPIGEKVLDPRNPNLGVDCLSCHRAHGTEYKRLMPFAQAPDLCTKCHQKYKR